MDSHQTEEMLAAWVDQFSLRLSDTSLDTQIESMGRVEQVADGVAHVSGLPHAGFNELLRFEDGQSGLVLTLDAESVGVVILDDIDGVSAGQSVAATCRVVSVPVGESLLGRIVDPLGRALDNKGAISTALLHPVERAAPSVIERDLVNEPVETGILVVDALFALGRGQRELIVGDRATGKTSLAVDAIINQKNSEMVCVYVAIGQRATAVERVIDAVRQHGAPERCVFVVAGPSTSPGLQWIAPFAGMTIAEFYRDRGQHVLIVFDDLSKHAATHRELALLTHEPPGREAYPGDIFYLHARLLERAARLSTTLGGGSLTVLPIAETDAGNLSGYIPTNLISITDGQIVLNSRLFAANQRPAVDVGLSVSRVGGKAQHKALRRVSGKTRLEYAQFLELETFIRFGGLSDERVKARVARGERIRALLSQPRFATLRTVDTIALLAALADGVFDNVPLNELAVLRQRLAAELNKQSMKSVNALAENAALETGELNALIAVVTNLIATLQVVSLKS